MGNSTSRVVGCFVPAGNVKGGGVNLEFLEPLDEGLGHSFCYVRPALADSLTITPENSERYTIDPNTPGLETQSGSFRQEIVDNLAGIPRSGKSYAETSFKTISGASVSANASATKTGNMDAMLSCEMQEPAASFESTSLFAAVPLQPVPRGSGPLNMFLSGPLERGFVSGPLDKGAGFMSGPLDKGAFMSGPIDGTDRSNFSAPLSYGLRRTGLRQLMKNMSKPMKSALTRTFSKRSFHGGLVQKFLLQPMTNFPWRSKEMKHHSGDFSGCQDFMLSKPEYCTNSNLQWAHGKAGEDRVHVVLSSEQGWLFVGIYDGFSGPDVPDFLMNNLYNAIDKELEGVLWDYEENPETSVPSSSLPEIISHLHSSDAVCEQSIHCEWQCHSLENTAQNLERTGGVQSQHEKCVEEFLLDQEKCGQGMAGPQIQDFDKTKSNEIVGKLEIESKPVVNTVKDSKQSTLHATTSFCLSADSNASSHRTDCWTEGKKRMRLFELLQLEMQEDFSATGPGVASRCESKRSACSFSVLSADSEGCSMRHNMLEEQPSTSPRSKGEFSDGIERFGSSRENEGASCRVDSKVPKNVCVTSLSSLGNKDITRQSSFRSKLRSMHRIQKSLRKKLFPWSYDWHREQRNSETVFMKPSVIRRCKSGPVDHEAVLKAMAHALQVTEDAHMEMVEKSLDRNPELALMGSCVLVMLMKDQDVYVMNLGDSRVILAQEMAHDESNIANMWKHERKHRNRSRDALVRIELDRISEESPTNNLNKSLRINNPNKELSVTKLKMKALQLSSDHCTGIEEEVLRIKSEHPEDPQAVYNDRVKGQLKVTRAFGAGFLKKPKFNDALLEMFRVDYVGSSPYISCIPFVRHHRVCSSDRFLVLSSDGLYQYFSNEEVVSHVSWFLENLPEGDPAQDLITELLCRAAKKNGMDFHDLLDIPQGDRRKYHDDVSVMVISLEGRIWRSSG